jgi:conjugative transfer pilus assembly protein TraH
MSQISNLHSKIKQHLRQATLILLLSISLLPNNALAGLDTLVKNVFPSGTMSNVTKGAITKEQEGGHLTGGSVVIKTPANPGLQLLHVRAPSCKMGGLPCGAQLEILGGGISAVSSAELMNHLKGLVENAVTYGGMMAIKTLCPQCQDLMEWLDAKADWINGMAKTDCEDMTKLVDGMASKMAASSRATRQADMVLNGEGKDAADVTTRSKKDDGRDATKNPELESQLGDNFNLVWKALAKKTTSDAGGRELKELLMSISGTIIGTKDNDGKPSVVHRKSLINKDLIKDFMGVGGTGSNKVKLYTCDETEKCLKPTINEAAIDKDSVLFTKVSKLIEQIVEKVYVNQGDLTGEEETLVSLSSMPLITKIEIDLGVYSNKANVALNQSEFIEALCFDVVTSYLALLLQEVQEAVGELAFAQIADGEAFKAFEAEARTTMRLLAEHKNAAFKRYDTIAQSKARLHQDRRFFNQKFEDFFNNHSQD